jgi:signal peptidase II
MIKMKQPTWIKLLIIIVIIAIGYLSDKSTKLLATIYFHNLPQNISITTFQDDILKKVEKEEDKNKLTQSYVLKKNSFVLKDNLSRKTEVEIFNILKSIRYKYFYIEPPVEIIKDYFHFTYTENDSGVFSILEPLNKDIKLPLLYCLFSFTFLVVGSMMIYSLKNKNNILTISFAFILGGGFGNFFDLVMDSYVVDFIDLHYKNDFHWPTFNIADVLIVIGMILILLSNFYFFRSKGKPILNLKSGKLPLSKNKHNHLQ